MNFDYFEYTNQGGRDYNEDCVGSKVYEQDAIFVVADGLGGHSYGEIASGCVVDTLVDDFNMGIDDIHVWINQEIEKANQLVLETQKEKRAVLKSTAALLTVQGKKLTFAHVGDSRLYFIHSNEIKYFTEDHSVAYKKFKAGEITRENIPSDDDQSRLLRSIGGEDHHEPSIFTYPLKAESGDAIMICSDGAWEYIADTEILIDYLKSADAKTWAENMLLRIMDRVDGKNDNLSITTVILE
ncbi:MAG: serine/threonine-protein phosphatase [Lachnospiraceae bacterium]|nr:serine/threonine-protein phosphatase [Lachnospiraceae bacterium]